MYLRKTIIFSALVYLSISMLYGQGITTQAGTHMVVSGNAAIVVNDGSFISDGAFSAGTGAVYMKGSVLSNAAKIRGNNLSFNQLIIDKSANAVQLESSLTFLPSDTIQMVNGNLDLNGKDILLFHGAGILGESEGSRIMGDSGRVVTTTNLNVPTNVNPSNIGLSLTSTDNLGTFTIQRIHGAPAINGGSGMTRQYRVNYINTGMTVDYTFNYFDGELNGNTEAWLDAWKFQGSWQDVEPNASNATANTIQVNGTNADTDTLWAFSAGQLLVTPKIFLEGNYSGGLMNDQLRNKGLIPTTEPYTSLGYTHVNSGGDTIAPAVLTVTGNNAIVDWIFLQVRDPLNATNTLQTKPALLQRDGDIVDLDGTSPVKIPNLGADNYYIAVYHRNHLPIRTASAIALNPVSSSYDFSSALTQAWDNTTISSNDAMKDLGSGVYGLFGGNTQGAATIFNVRATGPPFINDYLGLLSTLGSSTNILNNQYSRSDVNMDGDIRATGPPFINDYLKLLSILGSSTAIINAHID